MSDFNYATITSITPVLSARNDTTFTVTWDPPEDTSLVVKVEVYRFIGEKNVYNPPTTIGAAHVAGPIFTSTSNFDTITSYDDDLSGYYSSGSTFIKNSHALTDSDAIDDQHVIHDVIYSQRAIYYFVVTTTTSTQYGTLPYCLVSYTQWGRMDCFSTKTQVQHDVFHQEGDLIWSTKLPQAATNTGVGLSRTSVDMNRITQEPLYHAGPGGYGGWGWVSCRSNGKLFKIAMSNGLQNVVYSLPNRTNGFPIGIEAINGQCFSGNSIATRTDSGIIKCINNTLTSNTYNTQGLTEGLDKFTTTYPTAAAGFYYYYGMARIPTTNTSFYLNIKSMYGTTSGGLVIYNGATGSFNRVITFGNGYGVAAGKDGVGFITGLDGEGIKYYNPTTTTTGTVATPTVGSTALKYCGITTDFPNIYPNTTAGTYNVFITQVSHGNGSNPHVYKATWNGTTLGSFDTAIQFSPRYSADGSTDSTVRGVGIDSENNVWGVGTIVGKYYQSSNTAVYPFGGSARYPAIELQSWPSSKTNTKEIEWFLTRNAHIDDLCGRSSAYASTDYLGTRVNNYATYSTSSTIDDTIDVEWWTGRTETAREAYDWILSSGPGIGGGVYRASRTLQYTNNPELTTGSIQPKYVNGTAGVYTANWGKSVYTATPDNPVTNAARIATAQELIRAWSNAFAKRSTSYVGVTNRTTLINNNLSGCQITPHFNDTTRAVVFASRGFAYQYSDFTGNILLTVDTTSQTFTDVDSPDVSLPSCDLVVANSSSSSNYSEPDIYPWLQLSATNQALNYTTGATKLSGYDDLTVNYKLVSNPGSFVLSSWRVTTDDNVNDRDGSSNDAIVSTDTNSIPRYDDQYVTSVLIPYTYHDPTQIGNRVVIRNDSRQSVYSPRGTVYSSMNPYTGVWVSALTNTVDVNVYERWPEAKFSMDISSLYSARLSWLGISSPCNLVWKPESRFDRESAPDFGSTSINTYTNGRIAYGVDPLSGTITDASISRTYPISSWVLSMSSNCVWDTEIADWDTGTTEWPCITSIQHIGDLVYDVGPDEASSIVLARRTFRYGTYGITLNIAASTTATPQSDVSGSNYTFTQYVCVAEFEPFSNFWAASALTVQSTYSDETSAVNINTLLNGTPMLPNSMYNFASGYAPHLTVMFQNSSEAHTFPISSYTWNFGDYYNEDSNTLNITVTSHSGDFSQGCWTMSGLSANSSALITKAPAYTVKHTYTMPGIYDVTLTVAASNTSTTDLCARGLDETNNTPFYVYVVEIPPVAGFKMSTGTGGWTYNIGGSVSPTTVFVNASSTRTGSFPIHKIDWDWGDGTPIETVSRSPWLSTTNLGTILTSTNLYTQDGFDPRGYLVSHTYTNTTNDTNTYSVSMSAFAANTNTISVTSSLTFSVSSSYVPEQVPVKLISSRYLGNNTIEYVMENSTSGDTYYTVLSGVSYAN